MKPGSAHERFALSAVDVIQRSCKLMGMRAVALLGTRWKQIPDDPDNTGMEADACFYIGENAEGWYVARKDGRSAVKAFEAQTPPDLIVEVEWTKCDQEKSNRWGSIGVRELWRGGRQGDGINFEILALQAEVGPTSAEESAFFPGIESELLVRLLRDGEREGFTPIERVLESLLREARLQGYAKQ